MYVTFIRVSWYLAICHLLGHLHESLTCAYEENDFILYLPLQPHHFLFLMQQKLQGTIILFRKFPRYNRRLGCIYVMQ